MGLDDILKKANQEDEANKQKMQAFQEEQKKKEVQFGEDVKTCFANVITPTLKDIIETFKSNGFTARFGQDVQSVIYSGNQVISLSVKFKSCVMQIDFIPERLTQKVKFDARFISKFNFANDAAFSITEITPEKINSYIEANVKAMLTHCK